MAAAALAAAVAAGLTGCGSVTSGKRIIRVSHAQSETHPEHIGLLAFKEYVEENSEGKITVNIYPNSQMGGDREQIEGVQEGSITMMTCGSAAQANFVNSAIVFDGPFAFQTEEQMEKVFAIRNLSTRCQQNMTRLASI